MIEAYAENEPWSEFAKQKYLLEYCHQKNIQLYDKEGWLCIQEQRATKYMSVKNLHLYHYLQSSLSIDDWSIEKYDNTDAHVIVVENKIQNFVFDIRYSEPDPSTWVLNFFKRKADNAEVESALEAYIDNTWSFNGTCYEKSLIFIDSGHYSYPNVLQELTAIINKLEGNI